MKKQYLVVGLGRFGSSVSKTLYEAHEEVIGVDINEELVQEAVNNEILDNAITLDATDEKALKTLGLADVDIAFVCIGSNQQASIIITLILKELGIEKIIAKAVTKTHGKVLEKIGANQVIFPEEYMGKKIAQLAMEPNMIEHIRFNKEFLLLEIKAPSSFENKTLIELGVRRKYNINIVGIKKSKNSEDLIVNPDANYVIEKNNVLLVITDAKTAKKLESLK